MSEDKDKVYDPDTVEIWVAGQKIEGYTDSKYLKPSLNDGKVSGILETPDSDFNILQACWRSLYVRP